MAEPVQFAGQIPMLQNRTSHWSASTTAESLRFGLDNDDEAVPDYSNEDENIDNEESAPKRKRVLSKAGNVATMKSGERRTTSGRGSANERQKITRACDACKTYDHTQPRKPNLR